LEGRRRSLDLYTWGGGHSPSDVVAYLPEERILFAGDLVLNGYHPSMGDGYPREWRRILGEISDLKIDRLVPGHGPVADRHSLDESIRYHRDLRALVARARQGGSSTRAIRRLPLPVRYADLRFRMMWAENVARVEREVRAGSTAG
jgi:glyoxylase-like metal-dependent hydrolase (beta-lactamase superfamily II)